MPTEFLFPRSGGEAIILQKLGYGRVQPYAFMKLSETIQMAIKDHYHIGDDISIRAERPYQPAIDPLTEENPSVPVVDFDSIGNL